MSKGYSLRVAKYLEQGDPENIGVQLGRYCLKHDISSSQIAAQLGVTKMTIYNWFSGRPVRKPDHIAAIKALLGLEAAVE